MSGELKRAVGLPSAIATAVGMVVASTTLISLEQGFAYGNIGFLLPLVGAMLLMLFVAFSFGEMSSLIPKAGGINHYTMPAMGRFMAILAMLAGYLIPPVSGAAEAAVSGLIIRDVFWPSANATVISVIIFVALVLLNIRGVKFFAWTQVILTGAMIGTLLVLGIIGVFGLGSGDPVEGAFASLNPMGASVFSLMAIAGWIFIGIEMVCPLAEEIRKPKVYIPLAMFSALVVILIAGSLYGIASLNYVPAEDLGASAMPQVDAAQGMLGRTGQIWMGIVTILASVSTANALLAGIPRVLYGMAKQGQVPSILGRVHKSWKTPWPAIILVGLFFGTPLATGIVNVETIVIYILAGAISFFFMYIVAHIDVIILRFRYPKADRPFKTPLYPLPQLLGIAGLIYMIWEIYPDPAMAREIYMWSGIFMAGTAVYAALWVKFVEKKPLFQLSTLDEVLELEDEDPEAAGGPEAGGAMAAGLSATEPNR